MTTHPIDRLFARIETRKGADPATSYTAKLADFTVSGFWPAFWFSFVLSLINTLFHKGNEITFPTA